ncbi:uncharacterized protein K460DRAFT_294471 [Cucurbitaria berberidis CBS 394.84]|uniref:Uncharacterized protein n=1 Tax=Cucurbitaria berberidis CBS 394.84 TaxID=1168544 RepID=A0A9P4L430_9PLEO|nr:uncharacterized protein K460DRAFT_294471 [Cucurbitaria berberidis CBS 394.84]KAF1840892.1 hypothetical protein K460DRAFT_294471 [Cucurbitaria berberidis CBS 394.84]
MGKSVKVQIQDWIDEVRDDKLDGAYVVGRPLYTDRYCRLDVQGLTSDEPQQFNLQVQVNNGCPNTTMAKLKPWTVAFCLAPMDEPWTPAQIKEALKATVTGYKVTPPKVSNKVDPEDTKDSMKKGKGKKK